MEVFKNNTYDEERSLYGLNGALVQDCVFAGPADGESPLKECKNIVVEDCKFELRYPFWHFDNGKLKNVELTDTCRAALWYDKDLSIEGSTLNGIKALRECDNVVIKNSSAVSKEFGWRCRNVKLENFKLSESEYPFFECSVMEIDNLDMQGKYSFQYVKNAVIRNSNLKTKDAFWHSENVTVYDSVIEGEYLAWYSVNLHLVRCVIKGTQPLCYAKGLVLEDCMMEGCDLAFEKSEVHATVQSKIGSIKNPASGVISAKGFGDIILDEDNPDFELNLLGRCCQPFGE